MPYVLTCQRALRAYVAHVPTCLACLPSKVATCLVCLTCFTCSRALRACVLTCLRANVPCVLTCRNYPQFFFSWIIFLPYKKSLSNVEARRVTSYIFKIFSIYSSSLKYMFPIFKNIKIGREAYDFSKILEKYLQRILIFY